MRLRRAAVVVVLVALLSTSVAAGNVVTAAERTVLSGEFVKETLAENDVYGTARTFVLAQATAQPNPDDEGGGPPGMFGDATERIVDEAVTEAYMQREVERNVDRTYGYLHGDREELVVAVDLEPVQDRIVGILAEEIQNASVAELVGAVGSGGGDIPVAGTTLNLSVLGELEESPASYEETRAEFRADVREAVVRELENETYDAASDDERLALVIPDYDPRDYSAAEKAEMVDAREDEIRATVRERIEAEHGEEIDATVQEQLDALADVDADELATGLGGSDEELPPGVVTPVADIAATGVEALATDMPYDTYVAETDDAKARLAANVSALIEAEIQADGTDQLVVADTRDPDSGEAFVRARQAVGVVDLLWILLPLVSLVLVGALWLVTRSPVVTAGGTGVGLALGGLPGYVASMTAAELLAETLTSEEVPPEASELLLGLVDRVLGVLAGQSLVLVVAGLGLIAVAGYVRAYGTPGWARRRWTSPR